MKSYTVVLSGKEYEILQDKDGKFIKPDFVKQLESYGTDVKPAHEPICVGRKPLESTVANNCLKYGTGGLNIDGSRVGTEVLPELKAGQAKIGTFERHDMVTPERTGRFPANLITDGSDEVVGLFPDTKSGGGVKLTGKGSSNNVKFQNNTIVGNNWQADSGSAARFFYTAKASKSERNAGLEGFELKEPPASARSKPAEGRQNALGEPRQNHHPTVKPLSLTKYLSGLIKPPTGGRLLVPFSGSGSEMIGALQAGWEYVEGVELTEEYIPIAEARIKYWTKEPEQGKLL